MKPFAALALALLAFAPAGRTGPAIPPLLVLVKGTISTQQGMSEATARTKVTKFDTDDLFTEFGLSKADYALVLDLLSTRGVFFRQKDPAGPLPDVFVLNFDNASGSIDSKDKLYTLGYTASSSATGTAFDGVMGGVVGTIAYKGSIDSTNLGKGTFKFLGVAPGATFRFTFKATGQF